MPWFFEMRAQGGQRQEGARVETGFGQAAGFRRQKGCHRMGDHVADQPVFAQEDLVADHTVLDRLAAGPKSGQRGGGGAGRDAGQQLKPCVFQHSLPIGKRIVLDRSQMVFV